MSNTLVLQIRRYIFSQMSWNVPQCMQCFQWMWCWRLVLNNKSLTEQHPGREKIALERSEKLRNCFVTVVSKMGAYFHRVDCSLCAAVFTLFSLSTFAPLCICFVPTTECGMPWGNEAKIFRGLLKPLNLTMQEFVARCRLHQVNITL